MNQNELESFSDYLNRKLREEKLSTYDIERRSNKGITQSYANKIKNGEILNPSLPKLKALALGLGVPEQEVINKARGKKDNNAVSHERLNNISLRFDGLSPEKQTRADAIIEMMEREIERLANEKT